MIELKAPDFTDPEPPEDLDFITDQECAGCDKPVCIIEVEGEDEYGRERGGYAWRITFEDDDGNLFCEDCAADRDEQGPST
jgi:hypothetical protein